ncbi:hypothetical protein PLICBS_003862 [Purpureocillium lilacinum]|uniref:uncharacterized protein n=1 Tax=Purpureocillium lilacinum TaxID=33203 RepID=UPI00208BDC66|nr:hypothetical protein PLICBS_003862 [Purpureocillium lilacinum]
MPTHGFLVPDSFEFVVPNDVDMNISSIFWGLSLGIAFFAAEQAGRQSLQSWRRTNKVTAYVAMIWVEWTASVVIGVLAWCYQRQYIPPSFQLFFITACFWSIQIQLLMQIIINRIALLMVPATGAYRLKWGVFLLLLLVNISVLVIWIPARLQISARWIHINEIWDRCEKVIFLLVDFSLNMRFVFLVRSSLVNYGLTKYKRLYQFNLVMVAFSMSLDVIIIGVMSLPSDLVYLHLLEPKVLSKHVTATE